jgi:hypothetical protein
MVVGALSLPAATVNRAQQKGPLAVCASAGLFESLCAFRYFAAPDTAANTLCA